MAEEQEQDDNEQQQTTKNSNISSSNFIQKMKIALFPFSRNFFSSRNTSNKQKNNNNSNKIDIFISHDWPVGVTDFGDTEDLLRKKPYFKEDIEKKELGNLGMTMENNGMNKLTQIIKKRVNLKDGDMVKYQSTKVNIKMIKKKESGLDTMKLD